MCTSVHLLHPCNKVGAHLPFRKNTNNADKAAGVPPLTGTGGCPLFHLRTVSSSLSQQPFHCNQSFSQRRYRLSSHSAASLLLSAICFAHKPGGGAEREARRRPLAARADGDSFTNLDWNTTINYGARRIKPGRIRPAGSLIKQRHGQTAEH